MAATQYTPPWYISLPSGLTPFSDASSGMTVWTAPQVGGSYGSLADLVSAYNATLGAAYAANPAITEGAVSSELTRRAGKLFRQQTRSQRLGPVTTDVTSVATAGTALGQATKNIPFAAGGVPNVANCKLVDWGLGDDGAHYSVSATVWAMPTYPAGGTQQVRPIRFMTDARYLSVALYYGHGYQLFIDNVPQTLTPQIMGNTGAVYLNITFPSAGPRLIEIKTDNFCAGINTEPTASVWKPKPNDGPKVLCVGDSIVAGYYATYYFGAMQTLADYCDIDSIGFDGIGGTGFIRRTSTTPNNNYLDRLPYHIASGADVVLVHGGINDLYNGQTMAATQAACLQYFTGLRTGLPNAKLIFMEPHYAPIFAALSASSYTTYCQWARNTLPAALGGVYFIDAWTSGQWITGTGYQGATNGSGNSDSYIFTDATHPNDAGSAYLRHRIIPQLLPILAA